MPTPETCTGCKNTLQKYMIVCDNSCGAKYCSDECANAHIGDHLCNTHKYNKNNNEIVSYHPSHKVHLSKVIGQFGRSVISKITSVFH